MAFADYFTLTSVAFVRLVLAIVLFVAAFLKFPNLRAFADSVEEFTVLPQITRPLAYLHPFFELGISLLLFLEFNLVFSASLALGLMLIAFVFVFTGKLRGLKIENCGCYGNTFHVPLTWWKVLENLLWVLAAVYVILGAKFLGI